MYPQFLQTNTKMTTNTNSSKNFFETWVDSQKKIVDNMVENTQKVSTNDTINEALEKGGDFFKKWLDNQMSFVNQEKPHASGDATENINAMNTFYKEWLEGQMKWAKEVYDFTQTTAKGMTNNNTTNWPYNFMNNDMKFGFGQFEGMNGMNAMNNMNNFSQWNNWLTNMYSDMAKTMQNNTAKDAFGGMFNNVEGFTKFYELWMPMLKSINDKTFTTESFDKYMNPSLYKEFMDKFFGFAPDNFKNYYEQATKMMGDSMKGQAEMGHNMYTNMKNNMNTAMPWMGDNMFGNALNTYNTFYSNLQNAVSPLAKIMPQNATTKGAEDMANIGNHIAIFNIKNAEMQYMVYNNGVKVMDAMAEKIAEKVKAGEDVKGIVGLYQEWLSTSDKIFVDLFEGDQYSQLQAEISSLSLKLKKAIEGQVEKMYANVPLVPRSEMDELYKTIYDLKKQVYEMSKSINNAETVEASTETAKEETAPKAARRTTTKNS